MANDNWCTPQIVLDMISEFNKGNQIDLDPCASVDAIVHAKAEFTGPPAGKDGLVESWSGNNLVFVNPPYSRGNLYKWMQKAHQEYQKDTNIQIILLIPADTSTKYFQEFVKKSNAVCFLKKRVKFIGAGGSPKFPSALVYFGLNSVGFEDTFANYGWTVARG